MKKRVVQALGCILAMTMVVGSLTACGGKSEKKADWKNYKDDLTKVIINGKKADTNFTNSVIAKVLKKYNVKVVDKAFSAILDQYVTGSGASSSSSSSSSK